MFILYYLYSNIILTFFNFSIDFLFAGYNIKTAPDNFFGYPVPIILKNGFMLAVSHDILPNV